MKEIYTCDVCQITSEDYMLKSRIDIDGGWAKQFHICKHCYQMLPHETVFRRILKRLYGVSPPAQGDAR